MLKILCSVMTVAFVATLAAGAQYRCDLNGLGKVKINAVNAPGMLPGKPHGWIKKEAQAFTLLCAMPDKLPQQWSKQSFQFKADGTGKVRLSFGGQWAAKKENQAWLLLTNIEVNGKLVPNGDLCALSKNSKKVEVPRGFGLSGTASLELKGGPADVNAAKVNHDNRLILDIPVETGKTYTVTVMAKPVE
ncbi:MAG: hypothetical protein PHS41_03555 [Victivallaceae bacterium]|nr:hypothetical protein [Victivallaceae bacterium]